MDRHPHPIPGPNGADQRFHEIAAILAVGIVRLHAHAALRTEPPEHPRIPRAIALSSAPVRGSVFTGVNPSETRKEMQT